MEQTLSNFIIEEKTIQILDRLVHLKNKDNTTGIILKPNIKKEFKAGTMKLEDMIKCLENNGAICFVTIVSPNKNKFFYNYRQAFQYMVSSIRNPEKILNISLRKLAYYRSRLNKNKQISLYIMHNLLETAKYYITIDWGLPYELITGTKDAFCCLLDSKLMVNLKYLRNCNSLDVMFQYLTMAGCKNYTQIISPSNIYFYSYQDAFANLLETPKLSKKVYISNKSIQKYQTQINNNENISINIIHKYLSKADYKIKTIWKLPIEIK